MSPSSKMNMARKLEKRKDWNCINVLVRISWLSFIKRTNYMASTMCYSFIASSIHLRSSKPPTHMRRGKLKSGQGYESMLELDSHPDAPGSRAQTLSHFAWWCLEEGGG